jgi:hypothetical protein
MFQYIVCNASSSPPSTCLYGFASTNILHQPK